MVITLVVYNYCQGFGVCNVLYRFSLVCISRIFNTIIRIHNVLFRFGTFVLCKFSLYEIKKNNVIFLWTIRFPLILKLYWNTESLCFTVSIKFNSRTKTYFFPQFIFTCLRNKSKLSMSYVYLTAASYVEINLKPHKLNDIRPIIKIIIITIIFEWYCYWYVII